MSNEALPKKYGNTTDNAVIKDILSQAEDLGFPFFKTGQAKIVLASPYAIKDYEVNSGRQTISFNLAFGFSNKIG